MTTSSEAALQVQRLAQNILGYLELSQACSDPQKAQELVNKAKELAAKARTLALQHGKFSNIKIGDSVDRAMGGELTMPLIITKIDENYIYCSAWKFDRLTGAEVDEELGWGPEFGQTGSWILPKQ